MLPKEVVVYSAPLLMQVGFFFSFELGIRQAYALARAVAHLWHLLSLLAVREVVPIRFVCLPAHAGRLFFFPPAFLQPACAWPVVPGDI